jgi:thymidylate synthase ThyX
MQLAIEIVQPSAKLITPPEYFDGMIKIAEYFGRLAHKSEDKQTEESASIFLHKWCLDGERKQERHESVLEHMGQVSFHMVMSRAASHQLVRHRLCAFTQESQRYCDYSKPKFGQTLRVICPPSIFAPGEGDARVPHGLMVVAETTPTSQGTTWNGMGDPRAWEDNLDYTYKLVAPDAMAAADRLINIEPFRRWAFAIIRAYGRYLWLREQRVPAEDARFVLPNAAKTEIGVTANARQWLHMFDMRLDKHAQWEIKKVMREAWVALCAVCPIVFDNPRTRELQG